MKTIFKMLEDIKNSTDRMGEKIERIDKNFNPETIKRIEDDAIKPEEFKQLKNEVQAIKDKPAEKFDKIWTAVITAICTTAAVTILNYIIKK